MEKNETLDVLIELVESMVQEEGFRTLRTTESKVVSYSGYESLILKDANGQEYSINFNKNMVPERENSNRWVSTNYIK